MITTQEINKFAEETVENAREQFDAAVKQAEETRVQINDFYAGLLAPVRETFAPVIEPMLETVKPVQVKVEEMWTEAFSFANGYTFVTRRELEELEARVAAAEKAAKAATKKAAPRKRPAAKKAAAKAS